MKTTNDQYVKDVLEYEHLVQYHKERAARYKGMAEAYEAVLSAAGLLKRPEIPNGE